jgi:hypothetical protein
LKYPFICNGDLDCFYDIKTAPSASSQGILVWQFFWGGSQMGITPGHLQTIWLWVPTNSSSKAQ